MPSILGRLRGRLSIQISLRLAVLAVPLLTLAGWLAVADARAAANDMLLDQGRVAALAGAQAYGSILESGIDAGAVTLADLIEPTYEEIPFPGIRLEHKRYHTHYDAYTDSHGIQAIQDAILASSPSFIYASGMAVGGYVPTPHKKYAEPPTGDWDRDRAVSRAKRKYDTPLHLSAAGYLGSEPTLVQDYPRDGEMVWDVAAPITVRGKHFGAFRVGVVRARVEAETALLARSLARTLGGAILLLVIIVQISTQRAIRPLRDLACAATRLSTTHDGSELHVPIRTTSRAGEVGQMAKALDRLRLSFLAMWGRT
jgi:HAMP domain-containing protein